MTRRRQPERRPDPSLGGLVVLITVFTIVGLAIADFADDGKVDQLWIGALVLIALTFGGYGADRIRDRWFGP